LKYYLIDRYTTMGRLGKKLRSGLKLGAKIGAGLIGTAGVVGAGLFALGSKGGQVASEAGQNALEDFKSGQGSIANVSTADLENLYQTRPRPRLNLPQSDSGAMIGKDSQGNFTTSMPSFNPRPAPSASGIGSGLTQAQKDRDLALIKMLEADGV